MALLPAAPVVEPDEVTFEVLAGYEYEEGMKLPGEITKLHEKKVKVSGFMATEGLGRSSHSSDT